MSSSGTAPSSDVSGRKALKARYTTVHFCTISWKNHDFGEKLQKELDGLMNWFDKNFKTTLKAVVLESETGEKPEKALIKELKAFYEAAGTAAKKAEKDGDRLIAIVLYSGHGCQGPLDAKIIKNNFPATEYKPHEKGPDGATEPEDDLAPQNFQQMFFYDARGKVKNEKAVKEDFEDPDVDYSATPAGMLDWGYVFASVERPEKLASWVILQACNSGSATISKSGLKKKKLTRKVKNAKTDEDKDAAKAQLKGAVEESQKQTKKRVEKGPIDTSGGQGPVHYWTAVQPDVNAVLGQYGFIKAFQSALEATCAKTKAQKRQKGATREFGGQGEFRVRDAWNELSSFGADGDHGGDEDFDLFGEDKPATRKGTKGFERMVGVDQENSTKTRKAKRALVDKGINDAGKDADDAAKEKAKAKAKAEAEKISVPNAIADWRLPFYSTIPVGWEDMRLLQSKGAVKEK